MPFLPALFFADFFFAAFLAAFFAAPFFLAAGLAAFFGAAFFGAAFTLAFFGAAEAALRAPPGRLALTSATRGPAARLATRRVQVAVAFEAAQCRVALGPRRSTGQFVVRDSHSAVEIVLHDAPFSLKMYRPGA